MEASKIVGLGAWTLAGYYFYTIEFGAVFFLMSLMLGLWLSLERGKERKGPSAYNVFNAGGEKLAGTFAPPTEQFLVPGLNPNREANSPKLYTAQINTNDGKRRAIYTGKKVPRNSPCPCGSKIKYSKCCGDPSLRNITYDDISSDSD